MNTQKNKHLPLVLITKDLATYNIFLTLNKHYKTKSKREYEIFKRLIIVINYYHVRNNGLMVDLIRDLRRFFKDCFTTEWLDLVYEVQHPESGYISIYSFRFEWLDPERTDRKTFENKIIENFISQLPPYKFN